MKICKLAVVVVALVALQTAAFGAISLVYEEGPKVGQAFTQGRLIWDMYNWDVGTLYNPMGGAGVPVGYQGLPMVAPAPNDAIHVQGVQAMDAFQAVGCPNAGSYGRYPSPVPPGTSNLEDTWGIFRIRNITDANGWTVWSETGKNQTIYGIAYGEQDIHIEPINDAVGAYTGEDRISGIGFTIQMWSQTPQGAINPGLGVGAKVNTPVSPFYPTVTVGILELVLESLPGFINPNNVGAGLASEFESRFDFTQLRGDGEAWMEITGGASQQYFDLDPFAMNAANAAALQAAAPGVFDLDADFSLRFDTSPYVGTEGWLVTSHDPFESDVIPEPLTMLGLFMGLGGVGAYIRKRRMV